MQNNFLELLQARIRRVQTLHKIQVISGLRFMAFLMVYN